MTEATASERRSRRGGGRDARRAMRSASSSMSKPFITRSVPVYDVLSDEGAEIIENNAEIILEETGIDFKDDPEALAILKDAGADIKGERVRFPRGMCRQLCQTAPSEFTQYARNPERSVQIGGNNTVVAPVYGCLLYTSPSPRDLARSRMPSSA